MLHTLTTMFEAGFEEAAGQLREQLTPVPLPHLSHNLQQQLGWKLEAVVANVPFPLCDFDVPETELQGQEGQGQGQAGLTNANATTPSNAHVQSSGPRPPLSSSSGATTLSSAHVQISGPRPPLSSSSTSSMIPSSRARPPQHQRHVKQWAPEPVP